MDLIDERNRKQKLASTVIKRRNVVYNQLQQPIEESEKETVEEKADLTPEQKQQQEILARLQKERVENEASKQRVIDRMVYEREKDRLAVEALLRDQEE